MLRLDIDEEYREDVKVIIVEWGNEFEKMDAGTTLDIDVFFARRLI